MQDQFHQYKIIKDLAQKNFHATYLATPIDEPGRRVVLIVFSALLFSSSHEKEAVLEKARSLKKLQHANLVPVLDMGIEDGQPFVVREYVPNWSLRSYLKQRAPKHLKLRDALIILLQVGEVLAYAHSQNIFHGNIKPENILLDAHGQALLTDFTFLKSGAAMMRDQITEEYAFCYLAPEQLVGTWDAYADQYAMGCLAYELITGEVLFATESLNSLIGDQFCYIQPKSLSEKVPNLPPSLEAAVLKALAKDPSDRFADFSLFLAVMRSVVFPSPAFALMSAKDEKERDAMMVGDAPSPAFSLMNAKDGKERDAMMVGDAPSPAFPLMNAKAPYKQKSHSRFVQPPKPPAVLASTSEEVAPAHPLSQMLNASSAIDVAESEKAEKFINDIFKDENTEAAFMPVSLENKEMTEILPIDIGEAEPMAKQTLGHRKLFLGMILVGLIIAIIAASAAFLSRGTGKPAQSVDTSTVTTQQNLPVGTQLSLPISSRITLQSSPQANTQPGTNTDSLPNSALQNVPNSTAPAPAKINVMITNLGSFQCAEVLFKGLRLGNPVTVDDMQNNRNTITGAVTAPGMFSVDFYSTNDCSGTRGNFIRMATTTDATYTCDGSKKTNLCTRQS